jgi:hypothetical protein
MRQMMADTLPAVDRTAARARRCRCCQRWLIQVRNGTEVVCSSACDDLVRDSPAESCKRHVRSRCARIDPRNETTCVVLVAASVRGCGCWWNECEVIPMTIAMSHVRIPLPSR